MKGYTRTPEMTEKLIAAISFALRARPNERLGQILVNSNPSVVDDVWNVYDEKWIELLTKEEANG